MKPVVSSLVALALALAPLTAFAQDKEPAAHHAKVVHAKKKKVAKADEKSGEQVADKGEEKKAADKSEPVIRQVKAGKKDGVTVKSAVHHAKDVDITGPGHHEPKSAMVNASIVTKIAEPEKHEHGKTASSKLKAEPKHDLPKLPAPSAKPSKNGHEKGGKKAAEKKAEKADSSSDDGETTRDEELAELVARIRGGSKRESAENSAPAHESEWFSKSSNVTHEKSAPAAKLAPKCEKAPVEFVRGPEVESFEIEKCDGTLMPAALERFSVLIRPGGAARPVAPASELAKKSGPDIAPGIRRVNPHLLERVQLVAEHFGKPGAPAKLFIISGYRPASVGSMHSTGRAMDFRVDGVKNEDVVAFCKTINDTGCGYYPNSSFVHMDVRDPGTGHTAWIDASGPGETPRYVKQWPPAQTDPANEKPAAMPDKKGAFDRASAMEPIPESESQLAAEGEEILRPKRDSAEEAPPVPMDDHPALPADSPEVTP